MKLIIGTIYLGVSEEDAQQIVLFEGDEQVGRYTLSQLSGPEFGALSPCLNQIDELIIGFADVKDLDFLAYLPYVRKVTLITSNIHDITGLRYLQRIVSLSIERPRANMGILGELTTLKDLYLDDWKRGAESVFRLQGLTKVSIQKFPYSDLEGMANWHHLTELWLNRAKLETLLHIPSSLRKLRLTDARNLSSLAALATCRFLEDLRLDGCQQISSLDGLENCYQLKILTIGRGGFFNTLEPLRQLQNLKYVFLADGTRLDSKGIDALYNLPQLETLVIPKHSRLNVYRLRATAPNCNVILAG